MSKYIELEGAIKKIEERILPDFRGKVRTILSDLPTIEVSEEDLKGCDKVDKRFSEDCISREQVRAKLDYISYAEKDPISIAKRIVENAPSVIPKPKEGEWVDIRWQPYFCSICKTDACFDEELGGYQLTNYCPNCGAKMRSE